MIDPLRISIQDKRDPQNEKRKNDAHGTYVHTN
jgi:hypothetical protein